MKHPLLLSLLAVSVGANVWLALPQGSAAGPKLGAEKGSRSSGGQGTTQALAAGGANSSAQGGTSVAQDAAPGSTPVLWQAPATEAEYKAFVERMKAAGFPIRVIRSMLQAMIRLKAEAETPTENRPYWQREILASKEEQAKRAARSRAEQDLVETALGADGRPSAMMTAEQRERNFGPMPSDKIDALIKIERDYSEIRSSTYTRQGASTAEDYKTAQEQRAMIDKEKLADIAALLTPAEFEAYQLRSSEASYKVSRGLQDVTVTELEFKQLYQLQKAFDEANPNLMGNIPGETWAKRLNAQLAYNEQLRATLGDERFYKYAANSDSQYATISRGLSQIATVPPSTAYQVYLLQNRVQASFANRGQRPDWEGYNARLEALIGAEAAAAYRKSGPGRIFNAPNAQGGPTIIRTGTGSGG